MYLHTHKETIDGIERIVNQTASALHYTGIHPLVMLGMILCAGYVLSRLQNSARPSL